MKGLSYHTFSQEEAKARSPGKGSLPAVPCLSQLKRTAVGWNCGSGEIPWVEAWAKGGEEIERLFARPRDFQPLAANWSNESSVFSVWTWKREHRQWVYTRVHRQWVYMSMIRDKGFTCVCSQTMGLYTCVHRTFFHTHVSTDNGFTHMSTQTKDLHACVHRQWVYTCVLIDNGL